jgi:TonB family protein
VRGGILNTLDWPFVSTLMASFVIQVFSVAFIVTRDYPEPPSGLENLPDRFAEFLKEQPEIKKVKPKKVTKDDDKEEKDPEKEKPKEEPVKKKPKKVEEVVKEARKKAREKRRIAKKVNNKTILKFIGVKGDGEGGILNTLKDGHTDTAIADAFSGGGMMVAEESGASRDRRRETGQTGKIAGLGDDALTAKGPAGPVKSGKKRETAVRGKVKIKRLRNDEMVGTGVLDSNSVSKVVKRRSRAIKNCYEKRLKLNNKLKGKVKVRFTIEQSGRARKVSVVSNTTGDSVVGTCIANQIKRWRFPKPDGGSVTVAFPFVFTPSN